MKRILILIVYMLMSTLVFSVDYYKGKIFTTKIIPVSVAADAEQNVYIADQLTNSVLKYDKDGKYIVSFGLKARKKEKNIRVYPLIADIFVKGNLVYILDVNIGVAIFDNKGNFVKKIDLKPGKLLGEVKKPQAIFVSDNNIFISDTENNRIQILGLNGELGREFGYKGNLPGNFVFPKGVTVTPDYIMVSDTVNSRVSVHDYDGFYEEELEISDEHPKLEFVSPEDVFYHESQKNIFVVDAGTEQVKVFDENLDLILVFGSKGQEKNQFSGIRDIWVDDDRIYIADTANKCVKVFQNDFTDIRFLMELGKTNIFLVFLKLLLLVLFIIFTIRIIIKKIKEKRGMYNGK